MKAKSPTSICRLAGAVLLALSGATSVRAADYPTTVLNNSPLGYYRLSESVSPPAPNLVINSGSSGLPPMAIPLPGQT